MSGVLTAEAQSHRGDLTLNPISSKIATGSTVVFSGQLTTTSGYGVSDATIYIKDNVRFGSDDIIKRATTNYNGEFYTTWTAKQRSSGSWDFYAAYEGSNQISKAKSSQYTVKVSSSYSNSNNNYDPPTNSKHSTAISLNSIPSQSFAGNTVTFTGTVTSNGYPLQNALVKIFEDDPGPDERLGSGKTDSNGRFSIPWKVGAGTVEIDFDIYAVYDGNSNYERARSYNQEMSVHDRPSKQSTSITLYRIDSYAYAADTVTFTGTVTSNGYPLQNALVKILEDDPGPDQRLGSGKTDSNGRFSIPWKVGAGLVETDFDIYAVFDGDSNYKRDRSANQILSVYKHGGYITLDSFPSSARIGEQIIFTGTLSLDNHSPEGAIVYIKDEDSLSRDDLLATGYVGKDGRFSANWIVSNVDPNPNAEIYAVFEGNGVLKRLTTCGSGCTNTNDLRILKYISPVIPPNDYKSKGEFMELRYALDLPHTPRVSIILDPDRPGDVRKHVVPVQEGILMWTNYLEYNYGGIWNVDFKVVSPGDFDRSNPNIVVNLVTRADGGNGFNCDGDWAGWAYSNTPKPLKPVNTVVCSQIGGNQVRNEDVSAAAAHEFIHAMGVGHTFNKKGDLMCSKERGQDTCPTISSKSKTPSTLNLEAVQTIYGKDGFTNPNNNVKYKQKYPIDTSNNNNYIPTVTPKPKSNCDQIYDNYDWTIDTTIKSEWYMWWKICSENISYSFTTNSEFDGFMIFVLPPTTDVNNFMADRDGTYYTCEEYEKGWLSKPGSCNIAPGSHIVLYNYEENPINVDGYIRNQ